MRILLAGSGSGCGKTTASLLLMAVLKARGLDVAPYKVGPDYIDPGFHRAVCGRACYNLDPWLMTQNAMDRVLSHPADIAVIDAFEFDGELLNNEFVFQREPRRSVGSKICMAFGQSTCTDVCALFGLDGLCGLQILFSGWSQHHCVHIQIARRHQHNPKPRL